jgi:hypothetical protein
MNECKPLSADDVPNADMRLFGGAQYHRALEAGAAYKLLATPSTAYTRDSNHQESMRWMAWRGVARNYFSPRHPHYITDRPCRPLDVVGSQDIIDAAVSVVNFGP